MYRSVRAVPYGTVPYKFRRPGLYPVFLRDIRRRIVSKFEQIHFLIRRHILHITFVSLDFEYPFQHFSNFTIEEYTKSFVVGSTLRLVTGRV